MDPASTNHLFQDQEREKHLGFEKIAEQSTYLVVFGTLLLAFLPLEFSVNQRRIFLLGFIVLIFSFVWFRLLPKRFIGSTKSLLFFLFSVGFIFLGVHFTNGINSFVIFLFYLTVLRAAAYIQTKGFVSLLVLIDLLLLLEAIFFNTSISFVSRMSLWIFHSWALLTIAIFGRYFLEMEKKVQLEEESSKLKTAKQIDAIKNEFVFVISKKLKDPVFILSNYLTTALQGVDQKWSVNSKDFLVKASENTKRLTTLINDLSDLSSIENQHLSLDLKVLVLNQIITSTISDFSVIAKQKNIRFNYQPSNPALLVLADPTRLHEILSNLIDNAVKYSPEGASISLSYVQENNFIKICIADNGWGIPEEDKKHLFEKFYRVDRGAYSPKGTGLGLFLTKELVERQGGKIWFESNVNKGTSFYFTLPLSNENGR